MRVAVIELILRAVVAGGSADGHAQQRRRLERLIHCLNRLTGPDILPFGEAPTDGEHRRTARGVVYSGGDGVHPALLGKGREIHGDLRARRQRRRHLDVEHDLAVNIRVRSRLVGDAIDRDRLDLWRGQIDPLEVRVEIGLREAAAELKDADTLPLAAQVRREVVMRANLMWIEAARLFFVVVAVPAAARRRAR